PYKLLVSWGRRGWRVPEAKRFRATFPSKPRADAKPCRLETAPRAWRLLGAAFGLSLPLSDRIQTLLTTCVAIFESQVGEKSFGMRVLLIEDDSATAQSIGLMLKSERFNVYATDLGEEGVDLGKLYDYDIILLDLNLPDMSGFEVLRTLRVSKVKTPVLILT